MIVGLERDRFIGWRMGVRHHRLSLSQHLRMSSPPLPDIRYDESMSGPEAAGRDMRFAGTSRNAELSTVEVSGLKIVTRPDVDESLEHSIHLPIEQYEKVIDRAADYWKDEVLCTDWMRMVSIRLTRRVDTFGSFAVYMTQNLPKVERFALQNGKSSSILTMLKPFDVTFPPAIVFGQPVRVLLPLSSLTCQSMGFENRCDVVGQIREQHPLRLDAANLKVSDDVVDFLVLISARLLHLTWLGQNRARRSKQRSLRPSRLFMTLCDVAG
ncbi:uncharacterized protein FIBRA_03117 [Fibroporia radiculosa]|uniref:Uncharacterized protein n=1 Tax=Fibroporia radiculosa TaxID=599839 RepID=J4H282_9APHY|nr:uncharacterized protein FIBRA_03117 [Fibroporia radiculosa]CCM01069.1 predicted protein [Fibroporia radiculosa]